ncbi:MFS transporter [Enterococcus faecium]|uniref:MFS transporter n=1 Tax=Enterococcus faecium TaxID=1352 RepID=UPI003BAF41D6
MIGKTPIVKLSVSCIKMLHALEVPLFTLPMFRYFTLHFDTKLSATLYMIGFQIAAQIGQVILSTPLGILRDNVGYQPTFKIISLIVLLAGIYAFFILKQDDRDVQGDPFIRG